MAEEPDEIKPMTPEQVALLMKNPEILKGLQKLFGRLGPPPGIVEDLTMATEEERNRFTEWYRERGPRSDWCWSDEVPAPDRPVYTNPATGDRWHFDGRLYYVDFAPRQHPEPMYDDFAEAKRLTAQLLHGYPPKPMLPGFVCDCGDKACNAGLVVTD